MSGTFLFFLSVFVRVRVRACVCERICYCDLACKFIGCCCCCCFSAQARGKCIVPKQRANLDPHRVTRGDLFLCKKYKPQSCAERSSAAAKRGLTSLLGLATCSCKHGGLIVEGPKDLKDLRKLGVRNIAQQTWHFLRFSFFPPTFTSSILSAMFTGACDPPEKLSLALVPRSYVLRMIVKLAFPLKWSTFINLSQVSAYQSYCCFQHEFFSLRTCMVMSASFAILKNSKVSQVYYRVYRP